MNFIVEVSDTADAEVDAAYFLLSARNPEFAGRWLEGFYRTIATLETFPLRHPRVEESAVLSCEVQRMIYRNGRSVYRILFTLLAADGDGDLDMVRVLPVRHGAQLPVGETDTEDQP